MPSFSQEIKPTTHDFNNAEILISANGNQRVASRKVLKAKHYPNYFSDNLLRFLAGKSGKIYARKKGLVLGEGAFGIVSPACDKDGNFFAIKDVALKSLREEDKLKLMAEVSREFGFSKKLLIAEEFFEIIESDSDDDTSKALVSVKSNKDRSFRQSYSIVHKYLGIDLKKYLESNQNISLPSKKIIMIHMIQEVLKAHDQGVAHRDIKLENFVINPDTLNVTLIDYGFAANLGESVSMKGTPTHIPPNYFKYLKKDSKAYLLYFDFFALLRSLYAGKSCFIYNHRKKNENDTEPETILGSLTALFTVDEVENDQWLKEVFSFVDVVSDLKFNPKNPASVRHLYVSALFMLNGVQTHAFNLDNHLIDYFSDYLSQRAHSQSDGFSNDQVKENINRCIDIVLSAKNGCWDDVQAKLNSSSASVPMALYRSLLFEALGQNNISAIKNIAPKLTDFNFKNHEGMTPIDYAETRRNYIACAVMIDQLHGYGDCRAIGNANFFNYNKILEFASDNNIDGFYDLVKYFVTPESLKDHLNKVHVSSSIIFSRAIEFEHKELVDTLVQDQDFLCQKDEDGKLPIVLSAKLNKWQVVCFIAEKQPYFGDNSGYLEALNITIHRKNIPATVALLKSEVPYDVSIFALPSDKSSHQEQLEFLQSLLKECSESKHMKKILGGIIFIKLKEIRAELKNHEKKLAKLSFFNQVFTSHDERYNLQSMVDCLRLVYTILKHNKIAPFLDQVVSEYVKVQQIIKNGAELDQVAVAFIEQALLCYMTKDEFKRFCEDEEVRAAPCFSCCLSSHASVSES